MIVNASIIFGNGAAPESFSFQGTAEGRAWYWPSPDDRQFAGRTWRFVADNEAVELWAVCDDHARLVADTPPACDRLEIHPIAWGVPDSLVTDHPVEVEQMWQDHLAGQHEMYGDNYNYNLTWAEWLERYGKWELWRSFHTPEMERNWLNALDGPGGTLFLWAGVTAGGKARIPKSVLPSIHFRANFHRANKCETIFLHDSGRFPLSTEEKRLSPAQIAQDADFLRQRQKVEEAVAKNIADLAAVREHFYSNPSYFDAAQAAVRHKIDQEFVAYCMEAAKTHQLPSVRQALKAVQTLPRFRALRDDGTPSQTTVWRWLVFISKELDARKLLPARGKGPTAKPALGYDVERHPSPTPENVEPDDVEPEQEGTGATERVKQLAGVIGEQLKTTGQPLTRRELSVLRKKLKEQHPSPTPEDVEREQESTGATERDTRSQELPDTQSDS